MSNTCAPKAKTIPDIPPISMILSIVLSLTLFFLNKCINNITKNKTPVAIRVPKVGTVSYTHLRAHSCIDLPPNFIINIVYYNIFCIVVNKKAKIKG